MSSRRALRISRGLARELGERTLLGRQRHGLRQMPGEYRRARLGVALHQRGMDGARRQWPPALA
ncbi:MAG TPA: hypothetical protein VG758_11055 [Hyphomicrobiaceae bacterium]|nr:hypothetical protein [Hyphomicrobiaceae bacterium]